jgi:hypothetical protein
MGNWAIFMPIGKLGKEIAPGPAMSQISPQITPLLGSILQAPTTQQLQSADRDREVRKAEDGAENQHRKDEFIPQVEDGTEVVAIDDQHEHPQRQRKRKHPKEKEQDEAGNDDTHIDLTA